MKKIDKKNLMKKNHKKNLMNIPKVSTPQIEEEKTKITLIKKVICT